VALLALPAIAHAQTWTALTHQPTFSANDAEQLTDGRILVQQHSASTGPDQYWTLTPDNTGSYVNGTWTQVASLPSDYSPLYHASQVLADGRVAVAGGEYNFQSGVWTKLAAIYDPVANTWAALAAPSGWANIGDAQSVVLNNKMMMLADAITSQEAILDPTTLTWTTTGTGKADGNDEEGWSLLPGGTVLTVDTKNGTNSEIYHNGTWQTAGNVPVQLTDVGSEEIGPAVLRPEGSLFYIGATGATAIYTLPTPPHHIGTWSVGPSFPNIGGQLEVADGPAALLPDGNVLTGASPGVFATPTYFFEYNGTTLTQVPTAPNSTGQSCYEGRMLVLPTGQVMLTEEYIVGNVQVYTAAGSSNPAWAPVITTVASTVTHGSANNHIRGMQFNGLSAGCAYGDDAQCNTGFPLVRITNTGTGHVVYCRTHNHSTMGIATGSRTVSTMFDVPATIETGASKIEVVANGIGSTPVSITVN